MAREFDNPEEAKLAAEWQMEYEKEKRDGGGNPLVEFLSYSIFVSHREYGRNRKTAKVVELVGERGGKRRYALKDGALPQQLQRFVEMKLGTDEYDGVVDNLRRVGRK